MKNSFLFFCVFSLLAACASTPTPLPAVPTTAQDLQALTAVADRLGQTATSLQQAGTALQTLGGQLSGTTQAQPLQLQACTQTGAFYASAGVVFGGTNYPAGCYQCTQGGTLQALSPCPQGVGPGAPRRFILRAGSKKGGLRQEQEIILQ